MFNSRAVHADALERSRVQQSLYASKVLDPCGFSLRTYRRIDDWFVSMHEYCAGKTLGDLAENLFGLKDIDGDPLMLALATPKNRTEIDLFPTILVEGSRKILYICGPNRCINFAQPAIWDSAYAAAEHERVLPCMTADEQAAFLTLLLPKAIIRDR